MYNYIDLGISEINNIDLLLSFEERLRPKRLERIRSF